MGGSVGTSRARDVLRQAIVRGEFAPGQRLVAAELAQSVRVTRGCVRQALPELTAEGLIDPGRGGNARVRRISTGRLVEILECLRVLEALQARRAAVRASEDERRRLRALGERMAEAANRADPVGFTALSRDLHDMIAALAAQATAAGLVARLTAQIARHRFRHPLRPRRLAAAEHHAIIAAITEGLPDAAEHATGVHIGSIIAEITEQQQKEPLCLQ
ncbi:GntR family transcriptional regulator [Amycolatopsis acidicola]|uniref:GntR family transcriptional regulator n=1 Tax=Amycolatopsis acidicola TaxID=2596893 RepID=UPI00140AE217|nr:GntR family transcriptional regulator [Amycolatopsis acidicola]